MPFFSPQGAMASIRDLLTLSMQKQKMAGTETTAPLPREQQQQEVKKSCDLLSQFRESTSSATSSSREWSSTPLRKGPSLLSKFRTTGDNNNGDNGEGKAATAKVPDFTSDEQFPSLGRGK
jgi:hypothetical protein